MAELTQEEIFELDLLALSLPNRISAANGKQQAMYARLHSVHADKDLDRLRAYAKAGALITNLYSIDGVVDMLRYDGITDTASLLTEEYLTAVATFQTFPFYPTKTEIMRLLLEDMDNAPILTHLFHNMMIRDTDVLREKVSELRGSSPSLLDGVL